MTHFRLMVKDSKRRIRALVLSAKGKSDIALIEKEVSMLKSLYTAEESEK